MRSFLQIFYCDASKINFISQKKKIISVIYVKYKVQTFCKILFFFLATLVLLELLRLKK